MDDTLTIMLNKTSANNFLETLNQCHSSIKFTMEIENNRMLPFPFLCHFIYLCKFNVIKDVFIVHRGVR